MDKSGEAVRENKGRKMLEKISSIVKRDLAVKTLWRRPWPRIFLIVFLILLLLVTSLGIWKAYKEPAKIDFPKISYQEITYQLVRGKIQSWGLSDIKNGQAEASNTKEIFISAEGKTFKTEAVSFQVLSLYQFLGRADKKEIKNIIYVPRPVSYLSPSLADYSPSITIGQLQDDGFFIIYLSTADLYSQDIQRLLIERGIERWALPLETFKDSNFGARWRWLITASILWLIFPMILFGFNQAFRSAAEDVKVKEDFDKPATRFSEVAGIDESKEEILKVVDFIKHPEKYESLGAVLPSGIILLGAPGVGKTLLAKAIAGECGFPFVTDDQAGFMDTFVGTGPKNVKGLFDKARGIADQTGSRVIIFMDEIDAVGTRKSSSDIGGNDEQNRTIAQLNREIDGLRSDRRIIVLAASNKPENIDPALMRPGRLSLKIVVPTPSFKGRVDILAVHTKGKPLASDVNLEKIARLTPTGTSGADLMNIANAAAIEAGSQGKKAIEMKDFEKAINQIMLGEERKSIVLDPREKWIFAVHEAGHAILGIVQNKRGLDVPLPKKISIIPTTKGMGGYTQFIEQQEERLLLSRKQCLGLIMTIYGGRVAEEVIIGDISSGAKNDYDRASAIAEQMATTLAMESDKLGQRVFTVEAGSNFLGQNTQLKILSQKKLAKIDQVIDARLKESFEEARKIVIDYREDLEKLANKIKSEETIEITKKMIDDIKIKQAALP